jgi:hypothetical protein
MLWFTRLRLGGWQGWHSPDEISLSVFSQSLGRRNVHGYSFVYIDKIELRWSHLAMGKILV